MSERFTNRIHRDDIAGAVIFLMQRDLAVPLLVLSDDEPASQRDVTSFLAQKLGVPLPAASPPEPSARGGDKRCRNTLLRATGYTLEYPTYREGYAAMLAGSP
jgi:nucleoside-diphosphate-sugar epimerase